MLSFEQIVYDAMLKEDEEVRDYLNNVFSKKNVSDYLINEKANEEDIEYIYKMFEDGDCLDKAIEINKKNQFCLEAIFVLYRLGEEVSINYILLDLLRRNNEYNDLSEYRKNVYISTLNFYIQFLIEIHNITGAIKALSIEVECKGKMESEDISKFAYMYCLTENKNDFYDLYLNVEFNDPVQYLLLMSVLLKHEEELKAKEVFSELLNKYKYASFIDRLWELNNEDEEAIAFRNAVDICFDELCSYPNFFGWCSKNKEETYRS